MNFTGTVNHRRKIKENEILNRYLDLARELKKTVELEDDDGTNYHIYPTPPLGQDMTQGQFFKRSLTGLNSEFSFS